MQCNELVATNRTTNLLAKSVNKTYLAGLANVLTYGNMQNQRMTSIHYFGGFGGFGLIMCQQTKL